MKVGIIVYSKTGNTFSVAEKIRDVLQAKGAEVTLERFMAETSAGSNQPIGLTYRPMCSGYDVLIFGAPVQAFSLDPAMKMYFNEIYDLDKVPTGIFITEHLKKAWMGGNQATRQLTALLKKKGNTPLNLGLVNWSSERKESQIDAIVENCVRMTEGAK